jgi:hypothetical protein
MVVTEFACINFNKNKKCNQEETIRFLCRAVEIFEVRDQGKEETFANLFLPSTERHRCGSLQSRRRRQRRLFSFVCKRKAYKDWLGL